MTLTSNEPATIHYSPDGVDPAVGAANTTSGPTPLAGIQMAAGIQVLNYFGVDPSGNREVVKTLIYDFDLVSPNISLIGPAPGPIGLLADHTLNWQSSEAGSYVVDLGGNGSIGSGTQLAMGAVAASIPMSQMVRGSQLTYVGETLLWIYVRDGADNIGSTSVSFNSCPRATGDVRSTRKRQMRSGFSGP